MELEILMGPSDDIFPKVYGGACFEESFNISSIRFIVVILLKFWKLSYLCEKMQETIALTKMRKANYL